MTNHVPAASVEVVSDAASLLNVPVPRAVLPAVKVTVPVAALGVTVAVNLTGAPISDGPSEEASAMFSGRLSDCDCQRAGGAGRVGRRAAKHGSDRVSASRECRRSQS